MNPVDPFQFKQFSKLHPRRLWFTLVARLQERKAQTRFHQYVIPLSSPDVADANVPSYPDADTAVTPAQMAVLLKAVQDTKAVPGLAVEIGAYRGVTTAILASRAERNYIAVDPYIGYGGADSDFEQMKQRVSGFTNVTHLRMTSGEASRNLSGKEASFVFVDAVHDYVNALFDGAAWGGKLTSGGLIAFHDTDSEGFAGVQRAVWEMLNNKLSGYALYAHVEGLVVLRKTV